MSAQAAAARGLKEYATSEALESRRLEQAVTDAHKHAVPVIRNLELDTSKLGQVKLSVSNVCFVKGGFVLILISAAVSVYLA